MVVEPMTTGAAIWEVELSDVDVCDELCWAKGVVCLGVEVGVDDGDGVELAVLVFLIVEIEVVVNRRAPCTADSGAIEARPHTDGRVSFNLDSSQPLGHAPRVPAMVYSVPYLSPPDGVETAGCMRLVRSCELHVMKGSV
jgi:hypothetical protein